MQSVITLNKNKGLAMNNEEIMLAVVSLIILGALGIFLYAALRAVDIFIRHNPTDDE